MQGAAAIELSRVGATDNEVGIDVQGGGGPLRGHDVEVSHNSTAGINARVVTDLVRLIAVGNGEGGGLYVLMRSAWSPASARSYAVQRV